MLSMTRAGSGLFCSSILWMFVLIPGGATGGRREIDLSLFELE
jgi:hypothetical protein